LYGLLADESPFIREAAAVLAAKMLQAEAEERAKVRAGVSKAMHFFVQANRYLSIRTHIFLLNMRS